MSNLTVFAILLIMLFLIRNVILPHFYMKKIEKEKVDHDQYCLIDIRDFTTFNQDPTEEAKNIPLSYLPREVKTDPICDKDIVIIADGQRAAKMAARILKKQFRRSVYYMTV